MSPLPSRHRRCHHHCRRRRRRRLRRRRRRRSLPPQINCRRPRTVPCVGPGTPSVAPYDATWPTLPYAAFPVACEKPTKPLVITTLYYYYFNCRCTFSHVFVNNNGRNT